MLNKSILGFIFLLSCSQSVWSGEKHLEGSVLLNGKPRSIQITYNTFPSQEKVVIDSEVYLLSDTGPVLSGKRIVKENGAITVEKTVLIFLDSSKLDRVKKDPAGFAKESALSNSAEFACASGDNALILIGDELNAPFPLIGNCAQLSQN